MKYGARKDTNLLTTKKRVEKIIPIFVYLCDRLETGLRAKFFDDQDISKFEGKEIIAKLGNSGAFDTIKLKLNTMNDETEQGITKKLEGLFQEIIQQANDLD